MPPSISGTPQRRQNTPKHGVLLDDAQVGQQGQLETTGHGVAGDGGDDGLGELHPGRTHRPVSPAGRIELVAAAGVVERLEVGSGAERAVGTGEHRDGEIVVALELLERVAQLQRRRPVDGVAHLGSVDRDRADRVVDVETNGLVVL